MSFSSVEKKNQLLIYSEIPKLKDRYFYYVK